MKHLIVKNVSSIMLTILTIAAARIDSSKSVTGRGVISRKDSDWVPISLRNVTGTRKEHYHRARYNEYRSERLHSKYKRPNSNYNEWRPHFPAPAHSYLSPINNPPSTVNSYAPTYPQTPYIPSKIQSYDRPASIYPTAYYTKSTTSAYRKPSYSPPSYSPPSYSPPSYSPPSYSPPSYSSPSYFPPAHVNVPHFLSPEPQYPSLYYKDFKREPESYNHPTIGYRNKPNEFPDFDEFLRQSIAFQHFRP